MNSPWIADAAKAAFEAEVTLLGGGFNLSSLSDEDAKKLFGKIGEENVLMKKAVRFFPSFFSVILIRPFSLLW